MINERLLFINQTFEATAEQYRSLVAKKVDERDLRRYVKLILEIPEKDHDSKQGERILDEVIPLFERGRGNDIPAIRGSMWAAYNAFNEYLGYVKGRSQDTRLDSLWFGESATQNNRALNVALEMSQAG